MYNTYPVMTSRITSDIQISKMNKKKSRKNLYKSTLFKDTNFKVFHWIKQKRNTKNKNSRLHKCLDVSTVLPFSHQNTFSTKSLFAFG
jgi:hypothetical protein